MEASMNTISRNPTVRFSRKTEEYNYEDETRRQNQGWRIFSARSQNLNHMMSSLSYRRDRARKRLIFLQSYKLGSVSSRGKLLKSRKLKKMVVNVKSAVVSVLSFMRGGALRSCSSRSTVRASSPSRVVQLC